MTWLTRFLIFFMLLLCVSVPTQIAVAIQVSEYGVDANTVALYHFNGVNAGVVSDSVGLHDGQLFGDAAITSGNSGYFGEALQLDGAADYVRLDNVHIDNGQQLDTSQGSIELWVKLESWTGATVFAGAGTEYGEEWDDPFLLGGSSSWLEFSIWAPGGWRRALDFGTRMSDLVGEWHHVAGTWGSKGVELWLDGVLMKTNPWTGGLNTPDYDTVLIGTDSWMWDTHGLIDEVRISNIQRDFSITQITSVPEPSTVLLMVTGIIGIGFGVVRKRIGIRKKSPYSCVLT